MRGRLFAATGALATALTLAIAPSIPAGAATRGPAPTPNLISLQAAQHIAELQVARQDSVTNYTVRSGDTLSSIAAAYLGGSRYWPLLWWNNRKVTNPDQIAVGQVLVLPASDASMPANIVTAAMHALPQVRPAPVQLVSYNTAPQSGAPVQEAPAQAPDTQVSTAGDSSFEACVIRAESGGNAQVMNSTGHYGLFQFSYSTWVANGGSPAAFGNATAAQQQAVFNQTMATGGGESNWAPYDGC